MHVGRLDRPGRFESGTSSIVEGHTGSVLDFDWNPFDCSMFASASEDCSIKLWSIPDDWEPTDHTGRAKQGNNLTVTESLVDLLAHKKKVTLLRFHPTAGNVLASTSADYSVKVWDVESGQAISSNEDFGDNLISDVIWDSKGEILATSCKDKNVRFIDPRSGVTASKITRAHEGLKSVKLAYLGETGKILTTGTSRQREVKIWDLKNLSKPLLTENIDTASGALLPLFDSDSNILYLCGKGDGIIRPYEFEDKAPYLHKLNDGFRSTVPAKGLCLIPKRGCNVKECETARILKVTNNDGIHPLSWVVPRKSDAFQEDIFPDCVSGVEAHSAEEWREGSCRDPKRISLDFSKLGNGNGGVGGVSNGNGAGGGGRKLKTVASVGKELKEAKERILFLEKKLKDCGIDID
jgi:coronin-1B/1C/6